MQAIVVKQITEILEPIGVSIRYSLSLAENASPSGYTCCESYGLRIGPFERTLLSFLSCNFIPSAKGEPFFF